MTETIETVIVGGGQAGLSLSYYLTVAGREHVILEEASQPGDAWRNRRWDSFCLVTPNWTVRLPGAEYRGDDPHGYLPRAEIVQHLEDYARRYRMPLRHGVTVTAVEPLDSSGSYQVTSRAGRIQARNVVIATGLFQTPKIPPFAAQIPEGVQQFSSDQYRRPEQLAPGAVLIVGAAQSGCQITEELNQAGRKVYLATSAPARLPRRYRGRDTVEWLYQTGFFDQPPEQLPSPQARFVGNPQMTGKDGGHDLNLHHLFRKGVVLLGHLSDVQDEQLIFAPDLQANLAKTDQAEQEMLKRIDAFIDSSHVDAPQDGYVPVRDAYDAPEILRLDFRAAGIQTVIWAGGFRFDYSLVRLPVTDDFGFPLTQRGVTRYPGLYFLGMPWLYKRKSGLFLGVGEDAEYLAGKIGERWAP